MAIDSFIPTIWSSNLLVSLKKAMVYSQGGVVNTDYEGDIGDVGDTVKINAVGPVTVSTYTKNSTIASPQELTDAQTYLTIDQAKYFNFMVDDVDAVQTRPKAMGQAMKEAAYALVNQTDQYIAAQMVAGAASTNTLGTSGAPKTIAAVTDAYNYLVDLKVILDQNNVPEEGRWAIIPPWYEGLMLKDDRFVRAPISSPNTDVIINGQVRYVAGFALLNSNNVPATAPGVGGNFNVLAGTSMGTTYANQIVKVEAYRPPDRFADAVKGLHVYGTKVIRPEALAQLIITRPA